MNVNLQSKKVDSYEKAQALQVKKRRRDDERCRWAIDDVDDGDDVDRRACYVNGNE